MARKQRLHNLRRNESEGSPHRLLFLDSEARIEGGEDREVHTLRLWCARLVHRHGHEGRGSRTLDSQGYAQVELAEQVSKIARTRDALWVYTHNLSYDLTLTALPLRLVELGWELGRHNLASDAPWATLRQGNKTIRLADSWSWLPKPLADLGHELGLRKPELPDQDDSEAAWLARCWGDVEILEAAMCGLMDEWDRRQLGWWSVTGPGTAWNSMLHWGGKEKGRGRHHPGPADLLETSTRQTHSTVIDPDPDARAFERRAILSGRRDLWRWGPVRGDGLVELDFRLAHLTIAAHCPLPDRRGQPFQSLELDDWRISSQTRSIIAEVVVRTDTPRYPLRFKGAVWHPVGTFRTVLCGPEIAEAHRRGQLLEVGPGWSYRLGAQMQGWAQWALDLLGRPPGEVDPMLRVFLKQAARTVPGRWGMLIGQERESGPSHINGWALERAAFGSPPQRGCILHVAGRWTEMVRDQEPDDSFPAVLAHVQSWARLYLQRALDYLGEGAVLQVNTDSLLVRREVLEGIANAGALAQGRDRVEGWELGAAAAEISRATWPLLLRPKGQDASAVILSPQHFRLGQERRFAGVPRSAEEVAPNVFTFWTWPKLPGQLADGDPRGYTLARRTIDLSRVPVARWAHQDGCCEPVRAGLDAEGGSELRPPARGWLCAHGTPLRPWQHPVLMPLTP